MITYCQSPEGLNSWQLQGFFKHWLHQPSPEALLQILQASDYIVLAQETSSTQVVGYITAISDGISCAYIPHLEVHEQFRGQGIGAQLVTRMLARLSHLYMIDLTCDPELQPFYAKFGLRPSTGMLIRNFERQRLD
jgi:ribosomal protein S18 acetylase RimI-like enzyme